MKNEPIALIKAKAEQNGERDMLMAVLLVEEQRREQLIYPKSPERNEQPQSPQNSYSEHATSFQSPSDALKRSLGEVG
jgi:hypothetical protein